MAFAQRGAHSIAFHPRASLARCALKNAGVLYDVPVSNNGARVRLVARWKGIELTTTNPLDAFAGGLKSKAYEDVNPQMKMPTLVTSRGLRLPESACIVSYLMDEYADIGPSLRAKDVDARACASLAIRVHDVYVVAIQGAMYRGPMDRSTRASQIKEIAKQLNVLEEIAGRTRGVYIAGEEASDADASLFPTFVFMEFLLPKFFGWHDVFANRPNLRAWYSAMMTDPDAKAVRDEVRGGLEAWDVAGRFEKVGVVADVADTSFTWAY